MLYPTPLHDSYSRKDNQVGVQRYGLQGRTASHSASFGFMALAVLDPWPRTQTAAKFAAIPALHRGTGACQAALDRLGHGGCGFRSKP